MVSINAVFIRGVTVSYDPTPKRPCVSDTSNDLLTWALDGRTKVVPTNRFSGEPGPSSVTHIRFLHEEKLQILNQNTDFHDANEFGDNIIMTKMDSCICFICGP